ncbi:Chloroperoxidase [Thamnocephalis sphaerospora]|uniref:Chloroperoxidase n=1 Tax=Thamnocephalis sphaerospora TaxID=78915 RepID=A0A4P9XGZ8_9FUNG|nr:Chloroperoxidase [Thamnocephalis sphaerospora]|eukprot:RKP04926.1 Chloroperoxidase [Thamnocephalis sphaerospora]
MATGTASGLPRVPQTVTWSEKMRTWRDGQGQERSPCPFLNTVANHGIINYSGQDITTNRIRHVFRDDFGLKGLVLLVLMGGVHTFAAQERLHTRIASASHFHLRQIGQHGFVEHDASLTRRRHTCDNPKRAIPRDNAMIDGLLALAEDGYVTYNSVAQWRCQVRRQEERDGLHPPTKFPLRCRILAAGEVVGLLNVIGRDGRISVADAECFLKQERFPDNFEPAKLGNLAMLYLLWLTLVVFFKEEYVYWFGKQKDE